MAPAPAMAAGLQADIYVVDAAWGEVYLIDGLKALQDGNADNAVKWKQRPLDANGNPHPAQPLGVAAVGSGFLFVSFADGTLNRYSLDAGLGRDGVGFIKSTRLPRTATRLAAAMRGGTQYVAYVAGRDPSAQGIVYLLDPRTLEEKGTLPLAEMARAPAADTAPGGAGSRAGAVHSYAVAGLGFTGSDYHLQQGLVNLVTLTADPQAVMVVGNLSDRLQFSGDAGQGGRIDLENPVPLGPTPSAESAALATPLVASGEELFFIRKGNRIEVRLRETAFQDRSYMADAPWVAGSTWVDDYGDELSLAWEGAREYFSILCFDRVFPGTETTFFTARTWVESADSNLVGQAFPFRAGAVPDVHPDYLSPRAAKGLAMQGSVEGTVRLPLHVIGQPEPPYAEPFRLPFAPRGCHRVETVADPAGGGAGVADMRALWEQRQQNGVFRNLQVPGRMGGGPPYFGTDSATGGRYIGNFWLRDMPGAAAFTLPAEMTAPQDIDVVLDGEFGSVSGAVRSADRSNRDIFLRDVPVTVTLDSDGRSYRTVTDADGRFSVGIPGLAGPMVARVQADLRDQKGMFAVNSEAGYLGGTVVLKTRPVAVMGSALQQDVVFLPGFAAADRVHGAAQKAVLRDAAVFYYETEKASRYARDTLALDLDHKPPVDIRLHSPESGVFYHSGDSHINIAATGSGSPSAYNSGDGPDNREYHEFGHHVHADSAMGGQNMLPTLSAGDTNHGGVDNGHSGDSLVEGFAEYYALLVKGNARYRWAGTVTNLERNYHEVAPGKPDEEFNVAALLWDLTDPAGEPGDRVQIPIRDLWRAMEKPEVTTVRSLYQALKPTYGAKSTDVADALGDLDRLFVTHRFFSDANRNGTWDTGEAIGYADYYQSGAATPGGSARHDRPLIAGTLLQVGQVDASGAPVTADRYQVRTYFAAGVDDFTYEAALFRPAHIRIMVPPDALRVEIEPIVPGYAADVLTLTPTDFWAAVTEAQAAQAETFRTRTFRLQPTGVPMAENLAALREGVSQVRLTWLMPVGVDEVILVRGLAAVPGSPSTGDVIFSGHATEYVDSAAPDMTLHYAVFARRNGSLSAGATVSLAAVSSATEPGSAAGAVSAKRQVKLTIDSRTAQVDGQTVALDAAPEIVAGRTLVPLRFAAESLDAEVEYDTATRGITITLGSRKVELWLDQTRARIDGDERQLDVPPLIRSGRSLVPVRFVAEALGAEVGWDGATRTVFISQ